MSSGRPAISSAPTALEPAQVTAQQALKNARTAPRRRRRVPVVAEEAQTKTQTQRMVLKLGGATLVADEEGAWAHHEV